MSKNIEPVHNVDVTGKTAEGEEYEKLLIAARAAADRKAVELRALDIRKIASFAEFFLICSGTSTRQVQAIADEVQERLRSERKARPIHVEGYEKSEWVLMDYGDLIVHVFVQESREFYQLERLWRDAERLELPENL